MKTIRARLARTRNERGSLSIYLLLFTVVLVGIIGFVVDSSGKYQADASAQQIADNAARAAANSISGDAVYTGSLSINAGQAETTARSYLAAAGVGGNVTVTGQVVHVTVTSNYRTKFVSLFGFNSLPTHGDASAELITQ